MMHIVFITMELNVKNTPGGLGSFTDNMAHIFREKGHYVSVILASTKEVDISTYDKGIDLYSFYVPMNLWKILDKIALVASGILKENRDIIRRALIFKYKAIKTEKIIKKIHKNKQIDIIHCSHHNSVGGTVNIPYVIRLSSLSNIFAGADAKEGRISYKENPLNIKDKWMENEIRRARYLIAPSNLIAGIVKENIGADVTVIESPFLLKRHDWDYTSLYEHSLKDRKYVLHYGSALRYIKGTHVVAQLVKKLLQKYPELYLVLAGKNNDMQDEHGNTKKAYELIRQSAGEYADRVIYVGSLSREQLYPLVEKAEICLLPSRIENLSNACIEAMALGKIVVATNGASYEQLIDDRISGFLCERDNSESFMQGIEEALAMSEEEKNLMRSKAIAVTKRLSPDLIYDKYLDFYQKVIREWKHM